MIMRVKITIIVKIITNILKEKEIFDELIAERQSKIMQLNKEIKYINLTYYFKSKESDPIGFNNFHLPLDLLRKITEGDVKLEKSRENQKNI